MDSTGPAPIYQNVVVMRHGDRIDNFEPLWTTTASRPWDPPLIDDGKLRAFCTGRKLRSQLGFPIHRVFVSPFLRCIQTASEVVSSLCAVNDDPIKTSSAEIEIDPSKLKVSIEYGLCEMFNSSAIRPTVVPKDAKFDFNISDLEALLPSGTVDHSVTGVYDKLPKWEETDAETRSRYVNIIKDLADKYPSENLLLVTHGEGVGSAVTVCMKDVSVFDVEYCAYVELRRSISLREDDKSFVDAGEFEVMNKLGQTGIVCYPLNNNSIDAIPNA
ncbi:uncharacterized protein LOC124942276 [Impatiens glandulifera]|uniref:uncharacterized protein LOC124942276 n=1 Tax=Impatiens glandulifera TaxID=253017 RepID=UPI001FB0EBB7|nr:uncharacterized protein LOC124942276 [Impatiens glandulifera]